MKKCLHQIRRPSRKNLSLPEGVGECFDCETNEDNKYCKQHTPVSFEIFENEKNEED